MRDSNTVTKDGDRDDDQVGSALDISDIVSEVLDSLHSEESEPEEDVSAHENIDEDALKKDVVNRQNNESIDSLAGQNVLNSSLEVNQEAQEAQETDVNDDEQDDISYTKGDEIWDGTEHPSTDSIDMIGDDLPIIANEDELEAMDNHKPEEDSFAEVVELKPSASDSDVPLFNDEVFFSQKEEDGGQPRHINEEPIEELQNSDEDWLGDKFDHKLDSDLNLKENESNKEDDESYIDDYADDIIGF